MEEINLKTKPYERDYCLPLKVNAIFDRMGQSLSQIYIHLIFGTKDRQQTIAPAIEDDLHSYIAGIFREYESSVVIVNSMPDHIHILFRLSKNHVVSKIVEEAKKSSSRWMKERGISDFSWQAGYGAFSVSSSRLDTVARYIEKQKDHHKVKSFREEVEEFMKEYDVRDYQPDYFWK